MLSLPKSNLHFFVINTESLIEAASVDIYLPIDIASCINKGSIRCST